MDDDESRPSTAHRVLHVRKVPGSFDDDEISPAKEHFDDHSYPPPNALPSSISNGLKPENIPPLRPPTDDTTFLDGHSQAGDKVSDSFTEQAVRDHLQDVESSFAVPISPIPTITRDGVDDTFVFDSPKKGAMPPMAGQAEDLTNAESITAESTTPPTSNNSELPEQTSHQADASEIGNKTSDLEAFSSSPTAAATARTVSRSLSRASARHTDPERDDTTQLGEAESVAHDHSQATEDGGSRSTSFSAASTSLRYRSSEADLHKLSADAGGAPGHMLRYGKRPKYLRNRDASQRSSVSSFTTNDDVDSDVTVGLGADYALQSGGAVPSLSTSRSMSNILSRSVSMGSMLSGFEDFHDSSGRLETLDENESGAARDDTDADSLRTPKAKGTMAPPTDTTITRRVMNVHVPESLAEEYKTKGGLATPRKPSDFSIGGTQRSGRNLTLKEQSSTIERLSKENFDLKLKVMFLSDRLDKLSEEGVKEMIQENVRLSAEVTVLQSERRSMRRRIKELEAQLRDEDERPSTAKSGASSNGHTETFDQDAQEREEELYYLRERIEEVTTEIEKLRSDKMDDEAEKRMLVTNIKTLQSAGQKNAEENVGRQETEDVWRDLYDQAEAGREHAEEELRKLQEEVAQMKKQNPAPQQGNGGGALHHTTNIYNITKKPRASSPSRPMSAFSGEIDSANGGTSGASTLVEDLRREGEQLRHENAELRREVGAQTSMLTSRNKEKERLYAEIEDLKMAQRRGGPAPSTIDSLLDRSASQMGTHDRAASRMSGGTRAETAMDDSEREELENKNSELRDKINGIKLDNQTLNQELEYHKSELEAALQVKAETEEFALSLQDDLEATMKDLMAMQAERDDVINELNDFESRHKDLEQQHRNLFKEAQDAVDGYEESQDAMQEEIERLTVDLGDRTENFDALQEEMRKLSEALVRLEDEQDNKVRRIQQLEQDLGDANKELEDLEGKLLEANDKSQRLLVQQENSQGEIAFLREEQEGDKINISKLEVTISKVEESLRDEQDRVKQLQAQIVAERQRSESMASNDKKEAQRVVNELSREASVAKDEARKLRKNLTSREVEATEWKARLTELEDNLRHALGDLNGTRSSLLGSITKLQRELENTVHELDLAKASLMEKDRLIKQRDELLESHSLESRKVAEALEKERMAHRGTKNQFETFQKSHQHVTRTVNNQDTRIVELETMKSQNEKRIAQLEATMKAQLNDRNNLLLNLWTRLSSMCGTDWAHDHSLINGRALPSLEAVATMLPGFSKNLMAAVKTIESLIGGFQGRIKGIERDLWREYHSLEDNLAARTKKLERLEGIMRNGVAAGSFGSSEMQNRLVTLQEAYRQLKVENTTLRTANEVRARTAYASTGDPNANIDPAALAGGSPSPSIPTGPRDRSRGGLPRPKTSSRSSSTRTSTMTRPMTAGELALQEDDAGSGEGQALPNDPRWIYRLRDLESKLRLEREGRTQDRTEASRRLLEQEAELNRRNERDRRRGRDDTSG